MTYVRSICRSQKLFSDGRTKISLTPEAKFFSKATIKGVLRHLGSHLNKVNQIVGKQLVL